MSGTRMKSSSILFVNDKENDQEKYKEKYKRKYKKKKIQHQNLYLKKNKRKVDDINKKTHVSKVDQNLK